jgi:rod shape-determining protein MreB
MVNMKLFVDRVALDLGTVTTLIYSSRRGLVVHEPSAVAVNRFTGEIIAIGRKALEMLGREPHDVEIHRPLRHGTIADLDLAERMLKHFLEPICRNRFRRIHLMATIPGSATDAERNALIEAAREAGAHRVDLVEEGLAAAFGADAVAPDGSARMIVDIGGGTTTISIVSQHGLIASETLPVAGNDMTDAIREYVQKRYDLVIGERTAEWVKIEIGSALPDGEGRTVKVYGKSLWGGGAEGVLLQSREVAEALEPVLCSLRDGIRAVVEQAPPDAAHDVCESGIVLSGGGSLLRGLDHWLSHQLQLTVIRAERPVEAVVLGSARLLENPELYKQLRVVERVAYWSRLYESALRVLEG